MDWMANKRDLELTVFMQDSNETNKRRSLGGLTGAIRKDDSP